MSNGNTTFALRVTFNEQVLTLFDSVVVSAADAYNGRRVPVRIDALPPAEGFEPRSGLNVTRPSAQVEYVRNPVTGQLITRDEYNRLTGEGGSWWGNLFGGR